MQLSVISILIATVFASFWQACSRTYWWVIPTVWIPFVVAATLYPLHAGALKPIGAASSFLFGMLLWTLLEYCLHRYASSIIYMLL
jgi:4-hydroxysphinganine ceramide fatty acyl 2-hydroxylase